MLFFVILSRFIGCLALALLAVDAQPSPDEIFKRAQAAWQARFVPPYQSFTLPCADTALAPQCDPNDDAQFVVRAADGRTFAQSVPQPGGTPRVLMRGGYIFGPGGAPLGFYRRLGTTPEPAPPPNLAPDPLAPPNIATVVAVGGSYDVTVAGTETIDGRPCWHLRLRPLLDPDKFPLRDLWVDKATYEVRALSYDWDFGGGHRGNVHYRFAPIGPNRAWTIVHIDASVGAVHELFKTRIDRVSDDLRQITLPPTWPDADFVPPPG